MTLSTLRVSVSPISMKYVQMKYEFITTLQYDIYDYCKRLVPTEGFTQCNDYQL